MCGSYPTELYGRRLTLLCNNFFYISGALLAASGVFPLLFIGRFLTGLGVGITSVCAPVLLSEMASQETRGAITTLHQVILLLLDSVRNCDYFAHLSAL